MDHIVYLDFKSNELENLLNGTKDMILRGATGRKLPYGRISNNDTLYFTNNNGEGLLRAKADVKSVLETDKLDKETSEEMVDKYLPRIKLSAQALKRFRGKRYLVFIELVNIKIYDSIPFDKTDYGNMDDWLLVGNINNVIFD
ncbi:hypothetical protein RJI07_04585 [Mycoplasmatota bacterium WC30]